MEAPKYLWTGKCLERYIQPVGDASGAAIVLRAIPAREMQILIDDLASRPNDNSYRLLGQDNQVLLEFVPGAGVELRATPEYFHNGNDGLHHVFGLAVSHAFAGLGAAVIHAAAFELDSVSLLALGPGRSGKSTLTALALRAGARVFSDDTLLLRTCSEGYAHAVAIKEHLLFRDPTPALLPESLQRKLKLLTIRGERRLMLDSVQYTLVRESTRPTVFVSSQIHKDLVKTEIRPMQKVTAMAEVMRAVSPLFLTNQFRKEKAAMMPTISALARETPSYHVYLGQDIFSQPDAVFRRLFDAFS